MFSFLGKEEPALQLYGKLPIAKDYLRVGCSSGAGRALREWLDRGFAGDPGGSPPPLLPYPMRFLWMDRSGEALQGTLRPSSDAGGLRSFPLVLFVERRRRALAAERERSGAGDAGWWHALDGCHAELAGFADGGALLAAMRGRRVTRGVVADDATGARSVAFETVDFETWSETLWPGGGRAGTEHVLRELADLLRAKDERRIVRLPLGWGSSMDAQVSAWMRVLVALGWDAGGLPATLFYPAGEAPLPVPAFLMVLPADPRPEEAGWLDPALRTPSEPGDLRPATPAPVLPAPGPGSPSSAPLETALCDALANVRGRAGG